MLRGSFRAVHQGCIIEHVGSLRRSAGQNAVGLVMDATQGTPSWGCCSQVGPEEGVTHISQAGHPCGVLSSGGRWCSSAEQGPGGHAW